MFKITLPTLLLMTIAVVLVSGCATTEQTSTEQTHTGYVIPEEFQDLWSPITEDWCGSGLDTEAIELGRDHLAFYEGRGQVRQVQKTGPNSIQFEATMLHGSNWWDVRVSATRRADDTLVVTIEPDEFEVNGLTLHRCEVEEEAGAKAVKERFGELSSMDFNQ
jgi:hypothetical protein